MASQWEHIKWIPGTRLMVDGFRFQNATCKSYLLTHFHSDHTTGLTKGFTAGLIFCTPITARLLRKDMGMPAERICELQMDTPKLIEGAEVTPIDANHCPGACMFLIKTKGNLDRKPQTILHTGDLRWSPEMAEHIAIRNQRIDYLFLDTTYAKPAHTHPPQDICIDTMVRLIREEVAKNPRTLFVCGSYHIGKERAYLGAAKLLGWKVWCDANKRRVLRMLDLPDEFMSLLCTKPKDARLHVDFLSGLQPERLQQKISATGSWTHVVGFRPTGWTYRRSGKIDVRQEGKVKVYGIPYSEHSSYTELRDCVAALRPAKLVPTVNATNHAAAEAIISRFADLMDLSEDRSRLDFFMRKRQKVEKQDPGIRSDTLPTSSEVAAQDDLLQAAERSHTFCENGCQTIKEEPDTPQTEDALRQSTCKLETSWADFPPGRDVLPETARSSSCQSESTLQSPKTPPPVFLEKANLWMGKEAFQEQPGKVKLEPSPAESPFSNCTASGYKQAAVPELDRIPSGAGIAWDVGDLDNEASHIATAGSLKQECCENPASLENVPSGIAGFRGPVQGFSRTLGKSGDDSSSYRLPAPSLASSALARGPGFAEGSEAAELKAESGVNESAPLKDEYKLLKGVVPDRADSDESSTTCVDVNVAEIDVMEQERILQSIAEDRRWMEAELARSFAKKRQSSLAAFLRKDRLDPPTK